MNINKIYNIIITFVIIYISLILLNVVINDLNYIDKLEHFYNKLKLDCNVYNYDYFTKFNNIIDLRINLYSLDNLYSNCIKNINEIQEYEKCSFLCYKQLEFYENLLFEYKYFIKLNKIILPYINIINNYITIIIHDAFYMIIIVGTIIILSTPLIFIFWILFHKIYSKYFSFKKMNFYKKLINIILFIILLLIIIIAVTKDLYKYKQHCFNKLNEYNERFNYKNNVEKSLELPYELRSCKHRLNNLGFMIKLIDNKVFLDKYMNILVLYSQHIDIILFTCVCTAMINFILIN